ncbi:MAG: sulfotransferase domain-containing protein [Gemmatimonadota bacterium]|nr:sulfotransferase domain-containing protein [Gemmatimonadota bacterium]
MIWVALVGGAVVVFLVGQIIALGIVLSSGDEATRGLGYYGRSPAGREAFRAKLRRHSRLLSPILWIFGRFSSFTFEKASFRHSGLTGPRGTCTEESFAAGMAYSPAVEDVFVVTQMKSGTTWMQHLVYEILMRGRGDLVDSGATLYAVSAWLEAVKSVSVADAPLVGEERPTRLIKTHLPASACPISDHAKYIYVARHPVSCFASCADFIRENAGRLAPPLDATERWFCSPDMWWGEWPEHVEGWWTAASDRENVLFVHFEEMKRDLPDVTRRVTEFLGLEARSDPGIDEIVRKCGFDYMKRNAGTFEMHPPHLLSTDARLFAKGTTLRHQDVPQETRERVSRWCVSRLEQADYPLSRFYPDLT